MIVRIRNGSKKCSTALLRHREVNKPLVHQTGERKITV